MLMPVHHRYMKRRMKERKWNYGRKKIYQTCNKSDGNSRG